MLNTAEFKHLKMNRDQDSFINAAQLMATDSPGLEYYIQATDLVGNTLLFGYSLSLLIYVVEITASDGLDQCPLYSRSA